MIRSLDAQSNVEAPVKYCSARADSLKEKEKTTVTELELRRSLHFRVRRYQYA